MLCRKIMWGTMRHFCITFLFCFFLLTWNTKILVLLLRNVGTLQNQIWEFNQCVTIIKICVLSTNLQYYTFLLQTQIQYQLFPPFFSSFEIMRQTAKAVQMMYFVVLFRDQWGNDSLPCPDHQNDPSVILHAPPSYAISEKLPRNQDLH